MNSIRPSVSFEFDDKYLEARKKLFESYESFVKLTDTQKQNLIIELSQTVGMAEAFEQFLRYMNNGGRF